MIALGITCPQEHRARQDRKIKLRVLPLSGPTRLKQIKSLIFPLFLIKCIWDSVVGYRLVLSFSSQSPPAVWHSHPWPWSIRAPPPCDCALKISYIFSPLSACYGHMNGEWTVLHCCHDEHAKKWHALAYVFFIVCRVVYADLKMI